MIIFYLTFKRLILCLLNSSSSKYKLLCHVLIVVCLLASSIHAQEITINPRSRMVLNGAVFLVVNNMAFQNNGSFAAGKSTVNFRGHRDTLVSYVSGSNSTTFNNLSISKSAYGVALKSPVIVKDVLAVNAGNLYTDSNLTLRSDENLTARLDVVPSGSYIIGKANVERYIPARRAWRLITAPVSSSNSIYNSWQNKGVYSSGSGLLVTGPNPSAAAGNGLDYSEFNNISMRGFNYSTQQFTNVLNTKVAVSPGNSGSADNAGYFIFIRGDRNPVNTYVNNVNITTLSSIGSLQTGTQTFTASADTNKRYTLVGNPYASPVDFDNVTRTNLKKRFYVWDPSLNTVGGYVMLDDLDNDGSYSKSVMGSSQTKHLQSSQAFFVQTNTNAAASITFNEISKSGGNNNQLFRPVTPGGTAALGAGELNATLNLLNADSTIILADGALVEFDNIYNAGVDLDDAAKFSNTNENISIVRNNVALAAERRPALGIYDTVYLRLTTTTKRNYQFVFNVTGLEQPGMMGFLEDSYLGTSTLISLSGITTVNFALNAATGSTAINRFKIVFKPAVATLPVTITHVNAYQKNSNIEVEWKVENELNMVKYDVEKSRDGTTFTHAGTTIVNGGNNAYHSYNWLDIHPATGNNFYRIKSYDMSGAIQYSAIVKLAIAKISNGFSIYPNPVTGNVINLRLDSQPVGEYQVKLTNTMGQVIFEHTIQNDGSSSQGLNTRSKLPAGMYQLEITGKGSKPVTLKVIVE